MPWNVDNFICETIFPARIGVRPEITLITLHLRPEIK